MVEAVPLAPDEPCAQVDFLEDRVGDGAAAGAAHVGEVAVDRVEDRQHRGVLGRDVEVVEVGREAVAGVDAPDELVVAVERSPLRPRRSPAAGCSPATKSAPACRRAAAPAGWWPRCRRAADGTTRCCRLRRGSSARTGRGRCRGSRRCRPGEAWGERAVTSSDGGCRSAARVEALHLAGSRPRCVPAARAAGRRAGPARSGRRTLRPAGDRQPAAHVHRLAGVERLRRARSSRRRPASRPSGARCACRSASPRR